jgi:hypothetical protein
MMVNKQSTSKSSALPNVIAGLNDCWQSICQMFLKLGLLLQEAAAAAAAAEEEGGATRQRLHTQLWFCFYYYQVDAVKD